MDNKELNTRLLESFPELEDSFEAYTSWQDGLDTGCFLTYEDVFGKLCDKAIATSDKSLLERIESFLETLWTSEDEYTRNVIYVGVLERLKAEYDDDVIRAFLIGKTRVVFNDLEF